MRAAGEVAIADLERRLGHEFSRRDLLQTALTHGSAGAQESYQRLEFLGDRVLGLIVTEMLIEAFPTAAEGELSRRLAELVRKETCAEVAGALDIGAAIRFGNNKTPRAQLLTVNVLSDVCEAVVAAIYQDGGFDAARRFVAVHWGVRIAAGTPLAQNAKAALQEWSQARGLGVPEYLIKAKSGPDHDPHFEVEAHVGALAPALGQGRTRREAEQDAAAAMLIREGVRQETA
jgi:ribonuclease III